jgi:hypothetical protein
MQYPGVLRRAADALDETHVEHGDFLPDMLAQSWVAKD